ncbi:MAG TPA: hypothetical protein VFM57_00625 [Thermoleophilaceae bacterium]|nr:hypothetical protein [Thermoleophilaceae bacterium]
MRTRRVTLTLTATILAFVLAAPAAGASHPLRTGIVDAGPFTRPAEIPAAFDLARAAGTNTIRLYTIWRRHAPATRPAGFDPGNPADPAYDWSLLDLQVRTAKAEGLEPILSIEGAPEWATASNQPLPGTVRPNPTEFALFARAAARRYSGSFGDLPRVRYWQAWNEPNYFRHLAPQYDTPASEPVRRSSRLISPGIYRRLANAFADAVHGVRASNVVIAGGLSTFGNENANTHVARTLPFMRALLCMTRRNSPQRGCRGRLKADVWSHHPYTAGGPTHQNLSPEDVSLGDLAEMRRLLNAAIKARHIVSRRRVEFWATEVSWDTNPPDPGAVPMRLHRRWVAEALYRMWKNGISSVNWFQIRDAGGATPGEHLFESGMYFDCDGGPECWRPKPSLTAFRFPFVAFTSRQGVLVWGRTPFGRRGRVAIEQRGSSWTRVATLRSDRHGIFTATLDASKRGYMRARLLPASGRAGELSVPFSLRRVPDRPVNPFG